MRGKTAQKREKKWRKNEECFEFEKTSLYRKTTYY